MRIILITTCMLTILTGCGVQNISTNQHDQKPKQANATEFNAQAMIKEIQESEYYKNLQDLKDFVAGRQVVGSMAGNSGFILMLSGDSWAAAYRDQDTIGSAFGNGDPGDGIKGLISSEKYGDASQPVSKDIMYANEYVDIKREVMKSHGNTIKGLAYGFNTFNYAFEGGRELDFKLVDDNNNMPAARVFWEQW